MIELQDSYGKLMKQEHDLDRGIKYSKARHQDIKRYYTALNNTLTKELPFVKKIKKQQINIVCGQMNYIKIVI